MARTSRSFDERYHSSQVIPWMQAGSWKGSPDRRSPQKFQASPLESWMECLVPPNQMLVNLSLHGYTQLKSARTMGISQPAVHYRWVRLWMSLEILDRIGDYADMKDMLESVMPPRYVEPCMLYWESPNTKLIAEYLGLRQSTIHTRVVRGAEYVEEARLGEYAAEAAAWLLAHQNAGYLRWNSYGKGERSLPSGTARPGAFRDWLVGRGV